MVYGNKIIYYDANYKEEEKEQTLLEKIKKIFHKEKDDEKETFEESIYIEETQEDFDFDTDNLSDEEATVLLTQGSTHIITLKTVNADPEFVVLPDKYPYVIGKSKRSSDYRVSSNVVSRVHARINLEGEEFTIEDLNSTNGTFVNDVRLKPHEIKKIKRGDSVKLADIEFEVV